MGPPTLILRIKYMKSLRLLVLSIALISSISSMAEPRLSYVNSQPQFNITERFFALYIGVWRGFDASEIQAIQNGAELVSQRQVRWEVLRCQDDTVEHQDSEVIWTFDQLRLDDAGMVVPVFEAVRPGFRYFSLINLHGLYLRGRGDFKRPSRNPEESSEDYQRRAELAKADWWRASSPKGTRGSVEIQLEMRLVDGQHEAELGEQFIRFEDYKTIAESQPNMRDIFIRTAPSRWPVSYDERAHKPHSFTEPKLWQDAAPNILRNDLIQARLEWNWCDVEKPLNARIVVPPGGRLPPGPNRSGRADHGPSTIEVVEGEF